MDVKKMIKSMDEDTKKKIIQDLAVRGYSLKEFQNILNAYMEACEPILQKIKESEEYLEEADNDN